MEELFRSLSESVSEECFEDIMGIIEELLNESNRARRYGQKNINDNSKSVDIFGTKALKDSTQMNPDRESSNLIQRRGSLDVGSVPDEGDHDTRYTTMGDPDTENALKNKEAIQGAIKSLKQADGNIAYKALRNLKKEARELSKRKDPEENVDVLSKNRSFGGLSPDRPKNNFKNVMNSLRNNRGFKRLERDIKEKNKLRNDKEHHN